MGSSPVYDELIERLAELETEVATLRESDELFRQVAENIRDVFFVRDIKTNKTIYVSPAFESRRGRSRQSVEENPESFLDEVYPEDRERVIAALQKQAQGGELFEEEYRVLRADGEIRWIRGRSFPIRNEKGEIYRLTGISEDITERKLAQEALRKSEERFRKIFEEGPLGMSLMSLNGRFLKVNTALCQMLGYNQSDLLALTLNDLSHPEDIGSHQAFIHDLFCQKNVQKNIEQRYITKSGQILWGNLKCSIIYDTNGSALYGLAMLEDITARKEAQEALAAERALLAKRIGERTSELSLANAKLARAVRLKDEFLANMSHELRTPLNAILGMSEVLRLNVYGILNTDQLEALKHIESGGHHLLALINDILDLSKIEADQMELRVGPIVVSELCQASLLFIKQTAQKKQLKVAFSTDNMVQTFEADERRIKQVLVNLLSNAVKFTPLGGQVGLEVKANQAQELISFTVWDTGIGIAKQDMTKLFESFVQIDSRLSRQHEGTGLGLSLTYRLVELHAGGIHLESEVGKGSRFTVSLPLSSPLIGKQERQMGERARRERSTCVPKSDSAIILLAEDNETNIITVRDFLQSRGYQVLVSRNGHEAIQRAKENLPDLILMDIQMPELDGLEATQRIRAQKELRDIPIVALTALAMPGDRERILLAGANDYLAKPVGLLHLLQVIERQLQRSK